MTIPVTIKSMSLDELPEGDFDPIDALLHSVIQMTLSMPATPFGLIAVMTPDEVLCGASITRDGWIQPTADAVVESAATKAIRGVAVAPGRWLEPAHDLYVLDPMGRVTSVVVIPALGSIIARPYDHQEALETLARGLWGPAWTGTDWVPELGRPH